jgi:protein MpaA
LIFVLAVTFLSGVVAVAGTPAATPAVDDVMISKFLKEIRTTTQARKYKWDTSIFSEQGWKAKGLSVDKRPLIYFTCGDPNAENSTLILSSVHGDEVTPVYFGFRAVEWLKARPQLCEGRFIVIAPMVNPDGVLRSSKGLRTNSNKVDLNRNFDTPDWDKDALRVWKTQYKQRRYYPGDKAASEPETHFQKWLISEFKPTKILSVHAPLDMLDYDGPKRNDVKDEAYVNSCEALKAAVMDAAKSLRYHAYGIFPGSLGNYAGKQRGIPTFTIELSSAEAGMAAQYFGDMESGLELLVKQSVGQNNLKVSNQ